MRRSIFPKVKLLLDKRGASFQNKIASDQVTANRIGILIGSVLLGAGLVAAPAAAQGEEPIKLALYGEQAQFGGKIWHKPKRARALLLFWPQYESWWGALGHKHHRSHAKSEPADLAEPDAAPKGPLQIVVSIADQRISLYDNGTLIARSSVSTGVRNHPTPLGVFSVIDKQRWHRSNIYSGAPMPYMQRITWSGVALHEGVLPGHPASHGCIRLTKDFAIRLWHLTKRGTRVIIARDDIQPVDIANLHLFVPKPKAASASSEAPVTAASNGTVALAATQAPSIPIAETQEAAKPQIQGPDPLKVAPRKTIPISIFISRKLSKLFVRQGSASLLNVPIKIERPDEPLGTHVFTIMESQSEGSSVRWTVITIPEELAGATGSSNKERKASLARTVDGAAPAQTPDSANGALDRIEIPEDVVTQVSELLTPGSSLIISDYGMSHETGKDTGFIVVTH
jgi:L,D-transpeptidase catalytic domain